MDLLLIIGLFFPILSWLTLIGSLFYRKKTGKYSSAILIPIIGPVFINIWSINSGHAWWVFPIPWIVDIGTILFLRAFPMMLKEEWNYSRYNNLLTLRSSTNNQSVVLMLQKNKTYILRLNWTRERNESGILCTNDFGTYEVINDSYHLKSHTGQVKSIEFIDRKYICKDSESDSSYNMNGYIFTT